MSPGDQFLYYLLAACASMVLTIHLTARWRRMQHRHDQARADREVQDLAKIVPRPPALIAPGGGCNRNYRPSAARAGLPIEISAGGQSNCSHTYVTSVRERYSGD